MILGQKVKTFSLLDSRKKMLLLEAFIFLAFARILKLMPFSKVSPFLGTHKEETTFDLNISEQKTLRNVSNSINIMSNYTFWESKCLVKAIAGMKMLQRRKIESTLYLGIAKDKSGKLIAHAWLRSGSYYVTGREGMQGFTVVGKFARKFVFSDKRRIS
ncbi:lasso peptide biosynthesis B2 protein [Neobacillus sp. PS3-40]|uniref:lasso peptide biosynthesis B2 protein n=1 Tax=Neobacillus sp. PS3-40 TaxID=3070679 RepID=UPI0027E1D214|nr:lasso peptide biosynthesis B2 protein [Neobacillus sp. PS3-40]WML45835.1 lasso peptide biosynthesis B2 protein [Neobacillus sp. PS3-40]